MHLSEQKAIDRDRQPDEWEEALKDVTVNADSRELSYDPALLAEIHQIHFQDAFDGPIDVFHDEECLRQIEQIRHVADRKLKGQQRQCVLLLLATGTSYKKIAKMLHISDDTVCRQIQAAVASLKEYFKENCWGEFPTHAQTRPPVRAALFPLDTEEEKKAFLDFLNRHVVLHVAYSTQGRFREALVIYLTGKKAKRQ